MNGLFRGSAIAVLGFASIAASKPVARPKAPLKSAAAPKAKAPPDPTTSMVAALHVNSVADDTADLWHACLQSDFKALALTMNRVGLKQAKGEFETAEEFAKRGADLDQAINRGRLALVCQDLSNNTDAPFRYDADAETFTGSIDKALRVDLDFKDLGSYVGKTRMGISFRIHRTVEVDYKADLAPAKSDGACVKIDYTDLTYKVPVDRQAAVSVKKSAYLAILGTFQAPYVTQEDDNPTASLDEPYDNYTRTITVRIVPTRIVVVMPDEKRLLDCDLSLRGGRPPDR